MIYGKDRSALGLLEFAEWLGREFVNEEDFGTGPGHVPTQLMLGFWLWQSDIKDVIAKLEADRNFEQLTQVQKETHERDPKANPDTR